MSAVIEEEVNSNSDASRPQSCQSPRRAVNKTWNEEEEEEAAAVSGRVGRVGKLDNMFRLADQLTARRPRDYCDQSPPPPTPTTNSWGGGRGGLWHEQEC